MAQHSTAEHSKFGRGAARFCGRTVVTIPEIVISLTPFLFASSVFAHLDIGVTLPCALDFVSTPNPPPRSPDSQHSKHTEPHNLTVGFNLLTGSICSH